ncbi:MAG: TlpA family protein disulfide reductase [Planctomycetes bacterium]|nr:TlpA family protein disulfide reductase [Planctomycetota bacterium]
MNELHEKFADAGLVVVGVSDESEELLQEYIEKKGVRFGIIRAPGAMDAYGGRGYPSFFSIGPDGTILSTPAQRIPSDDFIENALRDVQLAPEMPAGHAFDALRTAWEKEDFERVSRELERGLQTAGEDAETLAGYTTLKQRFDAMCRSAEQRVERLGAGPDYFRSQAQLEAIADRFKGLPPAAAAKAMLDRFDDDAKIRKEIRAGRDLQRLLGRFDPSRIAQARKLREQLAKFRESCEGTYAAERATEIIASLATH